MHAEEIEKGLTVNIRQRSASEFFKKKILLRDLHLTIPKGHLVLLLGGSGAGKTTFLNAVTGYEKADATILLDGHDLYKEYESMKYDVGFVPQQDLMRGNDTVLMTLEDAATLRLPDSYSRKERKKRVME
ncbi:MAG: ATP-binding cassette domain-containing protein, partial [Bacteroidales bacterium]|nr:ATP-binding cassette domain-containing protein [Bacteroidales bacterium]